MMTTPEQRLFYEIKAEAFSIMTGHTAPDKGELCPKCKEEWEQWLKDNNKCIKAMLSAFDNLMDISIYDS